MGTISLQNPVIGQPDTTEDVKVQNNFTTLQTVINGNIDQTNLAAAVAQSAAVNQSGQTVKGSSIVATSQSTGSTTFTTLGTPDQVTGIVLPSPGLIVVLYQATWQESIAGQARADIFLNSNELVGASQSGAAASAAVAIGGTASTNVPLSSTAKGLASVSSTGSSYTGDVTTGQFIGDITTGAGGPCYIFAAAGTYTVSVQFKALSGTVTAVNRRLYVQALSFA